jgi:hypothetical protein
MQLVPLQRGLPVTASSILGTQVVLPLLPPPPQPPLFLSQLSYEGTVSPKDSVGYWSIGIGFAVAGIVGWFLYYNGGAPVQVVKSVETHSLKAAWGFNPCAYQVISGGVQAFAFSKFFKLYRYAPASSATRTGSRAERRRSGLKAKGCWRRGVRTLRPTKARRSSPPIPWLSSEAWRRFRRLEPRSPRLRRRRGFSAGCSAAGENRTLLTNWT